MKIKKPPSVINSTTSTISYDHKDLSLDITTNKSENTSFSEYYRSYGFVDLKRTATAHLTLPGTRPVPEVTTDRKLFTDQ